MTDQSQTRYAEYMDIDSLAAADRNAKNHDQGALDASARAFGFIEPCVIDERTGQLLAGHGRTEYLAAERDAGNPPPEGVKVDDDGAWSWLVVRRVRSKDDAHAEALGLALNRVGERGGWKMDVLELAVTELLQTDYADAIGWTADELDDLIASSNAHLHGPPQAEPPEPPEPREVEERCQPGELWQLGPHRLLCGDSRNPDDVARLLDGATINLAFTSPPYADRRKYDETTTFRPIPPDEYVEWFAPVATTVGEHLAEDGSWFVNIKPGADGLDRELYVYDLAVAHVREWGWHLGDEFCWERAGIPGAVGYRFKNQWESVFQFARARWKIRPEQVMHPSDFAISGLHPGDSLYGSPEGWQGRSALSGPRDGDRTSGFGENQGAQGVDAFAGLRGDGMAYPGNRLPTFSGSHEATGHAAAFPVGLPAWFVKAYTDQGDVVYDPFLGSGSTILAAEQEGRVGYGMELSPGYCDIAIDRWERMTGGTAELLAPDA